MKREKYENSFDPLTEDLLPLAEIPLDLERYLNGKEPNDEEMQRIYNFAERLKNASRKLRTNPPNCFEDEFYLGLVLDLKNISRNARVNRKSALEQSAIKLLDLGERLSLFRELPREKIEEISKSLTELYDKTEKYRAQEQSYKRY